MNLEQSELLAGQVAIVTGASRGIGAAIARNLADAGALVIGTATSQSGAEAISRTHWASRVGDLCWMFLAMSQFKV